MAKEHQYQVKLEWTGNTGLGTKDYLSYERSHVLSSPGKTSISCSSDPQFKGDATKWNPEDLLLASLASCHMLWYLHLVTTKKIVVTAYIDEPTAIMEIDATGKGFFKEAILRPRITITDHSKIKEAEALHEDAHKKCFIANSINFPVKVEAIFL